MKTFVSPLTIQGTPLKSAKLCATYANGAKVSIKLTVENLPDGETTLTAPGLVPAGVYYLHVTPLGTCCPERTLVSVPACPRHVLPGEHNGSAVQAPYATCEPLVIPPGDDDV